MSWINELTDEYSYVIKGEKVLSVSQGRIARLYREYQHNNDSVLLEAARAYMREHDYFPKVSTFKEYVRMASYSKPKLSPLQEVRAMTNEQIAILDDEIYAEELEAGTMRPLEEIDAEIATDRAKLPELKQAAGVS